MITDNAKYLAKYSFQAWELRMEKSAEKWGPGGRRGKPPEAEAF